MKKRQIGIIGAGNLGIRHLQAMALLQESCHISVMDVSEAALKKSKDIFQETNGAAKHEVSFVTEITSMPKALDAVIIATTSNVRRNVIETLFSHAEVNYLILEKVLFQRLEDYPAMTALLEQKQVPAFVNCPRRMYPVYERIKQKLTNASELEIQISGSDWNLASNGIHMLDFIAYLSGPQNIELDISGLDPNCLSGKRKGFLEITGTIRGSMGRCNAFSISSDSRPDIPALTEILSRDCRIRIMEGAKELELAEKSTGWTWSKEHFCLPYQSQLTHLVLEELFTNGSCRLTPLAESCRLHIAFIQQLIPYFQKQGIEKGLCPHYLTTERRSMYLEKAKPAEFEAYYQIKCDRFVNFWSQGTYEIPPRENLYRFYHRCLAPVHAPEHKEIYFIKTDTGEIAGYLYLNYSENSVDIPIALKKCFTKKGLAGQAIQKGLQIAKANGYRQSEVEIREDNTASIRLYTSCGYQKREKTRALYSPALNQTIDLYAYRKNLSEEI